MRSIGDGDDESDMLQHAVQTANNTAVYHLIQAGYDAQYLTATLIKKVREERVTEPNTVARQLALAKAKGHGGRFHVTNGAHMTCDDLFIAVEMSARRDERAEDEKKKKLALQCQDVEDKALTILQQERSVQLLNVKELDVLLAWHQAPKVSGAKKADKLVQWQNIVASEKAPPLFARWTNDDEERMNGLTTESISISIADTHYGRIDFYWRKCVWSYNINALCLSHVEYHVGTKLKSFKRQVNCKLQFGRAEVPLLMWRESKSDTLTAPRPSRGFYLLPLPPSLRCRWECRTGKRRS